MPGRQSHGRSLTQQPSKPKNRGKASKARSQQNALNAFNIAQEHFPTKEKKTPRFRALDAEVERKHARDEDDDEEGDNDDEDEQPKRKRARPAGDDDGDYGSDSEGNEWRLGGLMEGDEDSEIESDDAFGDSDNEKFDEYTFGGSKSKSKKADDSDSGDDEGDSEDEEGETLGAEAIDLATALDQWEEESEDEPKKGPGSGSESDESDSADSDDEESDDDAESASEGDDEPDADKLEALKGLVSGFGAKDEKTQQAPTKQKIDLGDLGLTGIDDPFMKNSVKLMNKESKEKRPGASKKLDIPLSRREQGRLDRSAAYDKTNETLSRWNDTVKQNRRAEHLSFPLAPDTGKAGIDRTSFQPIKPQPSSNDHEANILSILDEAGLTEQPKKEKEKVYDDDGNELTRKEIVARKRMEREKAAREAKRAARIKKIKSKAYHRVHRKQRERDAAAMEEADGEVDSEAEREAQDRRRALERVGQRHKESKWAKMGAKNKRAVWDEDFRAGLGEMARKDEELRRRKEGKAVDSDDETSSSGSDSDEGGETLLQKVNQALEEEDDAPQEGIMGMRFMRNAENAKRKMEREELERIKQYEEELLGIAQPEQDDQEIGRRAYGVKTGVADLKPTTNEFGANDSADEENGQAGEPRDKEDKPQLSSQSKWSSAAKSKKKAPREMLSSPAAETPEAHETSKETYGGWSSKTPEKSTSKSTTATFDPTASTITRTKPQPKPRSSKTTTTTNGQPNGGADPNDSDDSVSHMPLAIRDQELIDRTFAGDDVVAEFEAEKNEVAEQDDDKVIDNTLPGWGSWVGEGVSAKEQKRNKGRFVTKVEGVKKKNRQDAKLDRVIINEKRNKKNAQYLATQLPHPFESRQQYERSMRLPVGPEWQTKETFQDSTKPRVMVKRGVIAPIAKPH